MRAAITEVTSSGAPVPNATTVRPTSSPETPYWLAMPVLLVPSPYRQATEVFNPESVEEMSLHFYLNVLIENGNKVK